MKEDIRNFIAATLDVNTKEIQDSQSLYDSIGVDSTEMVELNLALQKKYGVKLAQNEINKNSTFSDVVKIIQSKKA